MGIYNLVSTFFPEGERVGSKHLVLFEDRGLQCPSRLNKGSRSQTRQHKIRPQIIWQSAPDPRIWRKLHRSASWPKALYQMTVTLSKDEPSSKPNNSSPKSYPNTTLPTTRTRLFDIGSTKTSATQEGQASSMTTTTLSSRTKHAYGNAPMP